MMLNILLQKKLNIMANNVYYLSTCQGCYNDASLDMETTSFGTDSTIGIQTILDKASTNPILVIVDGKFSISAPLKIRSNTYLIGLSGCGFILRDDSNCQMLINYNKPHSVATSWGTSWSIVDRNIIIDNIILNGNGQRAGVAKQTHDTADNTGWTIPLRMAGIKDCRFTNLIIRNSSTFAMYTNVCDHIYEDNIKIELPAQTALEYNYDGIKHGGPYTNLTLSNVVGNMKDDIFSLCANDGFDSTNPNKTFLQNNIAYTGYDPAASYGDINYCNVDNITFDGATSSWRLLSVSHAVKNVTVKNVKGSTVHQMVIMDNYAINPSAIFGSGANPTFNFENIRIENHDCQATELGWTLAYFYMNGKFSNLTIDGLNYKPNTAMPILQVTNASTFDVITLKNWNIETGITYTAYNSWLNFANSTIKNLILDNINIIGSVKITGNLLNIPNSSSCAKLSIRNITSDNLKNLFIINNTNNLNASNIIHTNSSDGYIFITETAIAHTRVSNYFTDGTLFLGTFNDQVLN